MYYIGSVLSSEQSAKNKVLFFHTNKNVTQNILVCSIYCVHVNNHIRTICICKVIWSNSECRVIISYMISLCQLQLILFFECPIGNVALESCVITREHISSILYLTYFPTRKFCARVEHNSIGYS